VAYRLVGPANAQIERILTESARQFGIQAAERYYRLMVAALAFLGDFDAQAFSDVIPKVPGVRTYPLSLARRLLPPELRVHNPRHIVVYRLTTNGVIEILGLAHDRMLLGRAARRMLRQADR
jgi:toxin ParE1/3/4